MSKKASELIARRLAVHLIQGINAENLLVDRGYDPSKIVSYAIAAGMNVVIHPKKFQEAAV